MDDERLIVEVEKHKIIYDTTDPFYKDNVRKDKAWHLIAKVIGVDADTCKARWQALRDSFVKNKKKSLPSGSAGGTQTEWKYSKMMSFLLPYIKPRSSKPKFSQPPDVDERCSTPQSLSGSEDGASNPALSIQQGNPVLPAPSTTPAASTSRGNGRPYRSRSPRERTTVAGAAQIDIGERLLSLLEMPVPKPHMPDGEQDELYHFCLSLVPMFLRLNKDRRQQAKIEILTSLHSQEKAQR